MEVISMSKNLIVGLIIISVLVAGGYLYQRNNSKMMEKDVMPKTDVMMKDDEQKTEESMMKKDETVMMDKKTDSAMMKDASRYVEYSPESYKSSEGTRRVLFFYASWCPTCIPANADFEKNISMIPTDVTVIRVNYNDPDTDAEEKALATKYGITYQHTYVQIDADGNEVTKWNGGSVKELLAKIK